MDSVSIGLDIGSSAVRAAEVEVKDDRRVVRRFGQVGIPAGWVVDGEVVNVPGVAEAIRRLWTEAQFTSRKVVLGVSGPRVFVRQADVPATATEDLRSSLMFNGEDLVPIPLEDAAFDFSILSTSPEDGGHRVLLVAAHKDLLRSYLAVLEAAGLSAVAMDSTALALLRAVPPAVAESGLEVIVSIGAELTTVAVRQGDSPRFIRTLTVGGNRLTASLAESLHLELAAAERIKRGVVPPETPQLAQSRKPMTLAIRDIAEDVRATIDFFTAQADDRAIERLLITGGASQTRGLAEAIGGNLPLDVYQIAPFAGLSVGDVGLDPDSLSRADSTATVAVGLALWPFESPLIRLSVLPEEVMHARQARRRVQLAATGLAAFVGLLALGGTARIAQVHAAQNRVKADQRQIASLTANVQHLQAITAVHRQMLTLGGIDVSALTGEVDWVRVLGQLADVMPPNVHITTFQGSRASGPGATSLGNITVTVQGAGNTDVAADWLDDLKKDLDLSNVVISGITAGSGPGGQSVTFSSTSQLSSSAQSSRAQAAKP